MAIKISCDACQRELGDRHLKVSVPGFDGRVDWGDGRDTHYCDAMCMVADAMKFFTTEQAEKMRAKRLGETQARSTETI